MHVTEYDADDEEAVEAGRLVLNAVLLADAPWMPEVTPHRREMGVRWGWDTSPERHLVVHAHGKPVAMAEVDLGVWDNQDLAWIYLVVHPAQRRDGLGTAFLSEISELARDAGRTKIGGSWWQTPATEAFARQHGFEVASQEIYRRATLTELPAGFAEAAYDEAAAARDYELVRLEGRAPQDLLPGVAQVTAAINDAPIDGLDIEDEAFPVERIRDYENAMIESGHRLRRVVARHRKTGELAGHTVVAVDLESPQLAHQHDTAVVGERLGYRALGRELAFQRRL